MLRINAILIDLNFFISQKRKQVISFGPRTLISFFHFIFKPPKTEVLTNGDFSSTLRIHILKSLCFYCNMLCR